MATENKTGEAIEGIENVLKRSIQEYINLEGVGLASTALISFANNVEKLLKPFSQIQNAAAELAKSVGFSSKSIQAMSERIIAQNKNMQLSSKYGFSSKEMIEMQASLMSKIGRNVSIDQAGGLGKTFDNQGNKVVNLGDSELENLLAAQKVFGPETVGQIVAGFDKLGKSMGSAAKATGKLFQEAGEYGLNLTKYAENFTGNLEMAQLYNFKNGINGLKEMAKRATEIRQNMKQVAQFADKVGSVTGAVETAAQLQVLGGSFAAMSNPLSMLNESLTDVEGLQKRLNTMTAGAAKYDSRTKQIRMDPETRLQMKRAAEAMGVDATNLIDQAFAQARKTEIEGQMKGYGGFSDEMKKLIPNVGEIDEFGRAGATIGGEFRTLGEIAAMPELQEQLIEESRSESDDIKLIAQSVRTIEDKLKGRVEQVNNAAAENVLTPDSFGKKTPLRRFTDFVDNEFTPDAIEGARKLDKAIMGLANPFIDLTQSLATRFARILNEDTAEGAAATAKQVTKETFGDNAFSDKAGDVIGSVVGFVQKMFNGTSDFIAEHNNKYDPGIERRAEGQLNGDSLVFKQLQEGVTIISVPTKLATPILSSTEGTGQYSWPGVSQPVFQARSDTVPSTTVAGTTTVTTSRITPEGRTAYQSEPYKFDFSGTLTMNINGDNGRIGTVDILNWMKNDSGFRREMAKAMAETMAEMKAAGQIENK